MQTLSRQLPALLEQYLLVFTIFMQNDWASWFPLVNESTGDTQTMTLDLSDGWRITNTFHTSLVRRHRKRKRDEGVIVRDDDTGEEHTEWRFERILDSRVNRRTGELEYKIQWSNSRPSWQPCEDVWGCDSDIRDFHSRKPSKPGPPDWFQG
jgi:hypothetical protein